MVRHIRKHLPTQKLSFKSGLRSHRNWGAQFLNRKGGWFTHKTFWRGMAAVDTRQGVLMKYVVKLENWTLANFSYRQLDTYILWFTNA